MARRRAVTAGMEEKIGNNPFRRAGIAIYLENHGTLELVRELANHASSRATKFHDRRGDRVTLDAVERTWIE